MAFDRTNLERVGGGLRKLFLYATTDAIATVVASGYFNDVSDELDQHDVIIAVTSTGGTPTIDNLFITSADRAATVTVSATEGTTAT